MIYKTEVDFNLKLDDIAKELGGDSLGYFASQTVHKHYTPAMPMNTGAFSQNIDFNTPWQYTHLEPYSVYAYNLNMNFRTDRHEFAMANYIEGFESVARPLIEQDIANFIKSEVLK